MIIPDYIAVVPMAVISLLWIAIATDLLDRRIPNWISVGIVFLFLIYCSLSFGKIAIAYHLIWSFLTFMGLFAFFVLGKIGGGDVKLSTAVMLWAGPDQGLRFLYITAITGGVLAVMVIAPITRQIWLWHRLAKGGSNGSGAHAKAVSVPYGLAISIAGTVCLYDGFLIQDLP